MNSALRLMSMGQTEGQKVLADVLPYTIEACKQVEGQSPLEAYSNSVGAEIDMMKHASLYSRLFMS